MNLSLPIVYTTDDQQKITECEEFRDMLTTCNLAVSLHPDKPNTAVRNVCREMLKRFTGERSRKILQIVIRSALPQSKIAELVKEVYNGQKELTNDV